jgi:hypothetical protein
LDIIFTIKFFREYWKEGIHLLFRTKRFGVNNEWWSSFDSMYGFPTREILFSILKIKPIIFNYRMMKLRAECGFLPKDVTKKIGW